MRQKKFTVFTYGEMKILFKSKRFEGPEQLGSAPFDLVLNEDLIREYLHSMEHIPHIKRTIIMEPTKGLYDQLINK